MVRRLRAVLMFYGRVFKHLGDTILDLVFFESESNALGTGCVRGWGPSGTSWHGVLVFYGHVFWHLGDAILDFVFPESESNVKHRPCPWFGAFGHLLAWCSGVLRARFLASWGYHSGPFFFESESNVRHRQCPWFVAFGHLLAWCSGAVGACFLASWGCHSRPCFL